MKFLAYLVWTGLTAAALLAVTSIAHADELPVNPDVTPENIHQTVCVPGWSKTVRPPVSVTNKIKFEKMEAAGIDRSKASSLELDHVLSIEVGGAPDDARNLRLQWWYGGDVKTPADADGVDSQAHAKDVVENTIKRRVCSGELTLRDGQACLWNDWRECAEKLGLGTRKEAPR